jgi:ribosome-binding protein aMBF1 (putative translation factor)
MGKKFQNLRSGMTKEQRQRSKARADAMLAEMPLQELRRARELSQEALAEELGQRQSGISKIEQRTDMYVSTLRKYIEAMGGHLDIVARFPDGEVRINQFEDLGPNPTGA